MNLLNRFIIIITTSYQGTRWYLFDQKSWKEGNLSNKNKRFFFAIFTLTLQNYKKLLIPFLLTDYFSCVLPVRQVHFPCQLSISSVDWVSTMGDCRQFDISTSNFHIKDWGFCQEHKHCWDLTKKGVVSILYQTIPVAAPPSLDHITLQWNKDQGSQILQMAFFLLDSSTW